MLDIFGLIHLFVPIKIFTFTNIINGSCTVIYIAIMLIQVMLFMWYHHCHCDHHHHHHVLPVVIMLSEHFTDLVASGIQYLWTVPTSAILWTSLSRG